MLKILVKKELQQIWVQGFLRGGRAAKKGKKRPSGKGMAILWGFLTVYLVACFAFMAWFAGKALLLPRVEWLYYLLLGGGAILFGTLGSVFTTYSTLYLAKDNDLLLSMPIPVRNVILSRLMGVYLMGVFYACAMTLPAVAVGLIQRGFTVSRLVGGLVWSLLITLIILALSCLLGWVVARISQKLKSKSFLIVLLSLTFLILYYVVYFRIINHLPELVERMLLYGESVRSTVNPLYLFGQVGVGDWLAMLVWTAAICLVLALIWLLLKRSFLSVATSSAAGKKAVYREETVRQGSASAALLRKEWLRFSSNATYMLNCGLGLLIQLALGVYLLLKGGALLQTIGEVMPVLTQSSGILPVLVCAICCLSCSMLDITAPSVSLEGRSVWLPQSLPVTPWQVLQAKLGLHLGLGIIPTLFCLVVAAVLVPATLAQKLLLVVVGLLFMLLIALAGLCLGVKMPNLSWTNEMYPIKQSAPVALTLLTGFAVPVALGGLFFLAYKVMSATAYLSVAALLLLAADAALFLWLRNTGARRFEELAP